MKKIVFAALILLGATAMTNAQAPASKVSTQKKESIKPASSVSTVATTPKKPAGNTKTNPPASTQKVSAANIGKHKKAHHKAAKKPAKKS